LHAEKHVEGVKGKAAKHPKSTGLDDDYGRATLIEGQRRLPLELGGTEIIIVPQKLLHLSSILTNRKGEKIKITRSYGINLPIHHIGCGYTSQHRNLGMPSMSLLAVSSFDMDVAHRTSVVRSRGEQTEEEIWRKTELIMLMYDHYQKCPERHLT